MKSFDDIINDEKPLNEGAKLYDEWKDVVGEHGPRLERMLLDMMQRIDYLCKDADPYYKSR